MIIELLSGLMVGWILGFWAGVQWQLDRNKREDL